MVAIIIRRYLSVQDAVAYEDDAGQSYIVFHISAFYDPLPPIVGGSIIYDIDFDYRLVPGSASAGVDYGNMSGHIKMTKSDKDIFISVPIFDDTLIEPDETFSIELYNIQGAAWGTPSILQATGTIVDNDVSNHPPAITFGGGGDSASVGLTENTTIVAAITAEDPDPGTDLIYFLAGGDDVALFSIDLSGNLNFKIAPDFETPADKNHDNVYEVIIGVTDGLLTDLQTLYVTITDGDDGLHLTGTDGNDTLNGDVYSDVLFGLAGNDRLDGKAGDDTMAGGSGYDSYFVDTSGDIVSENTGDGTDTVLAAISYVLPANVERLYLTGAAVRGDGNGVSNTLIGDGIANLLYGYDGNDTLDGKVGADTMYGGLGNDSYYVDNVDDDVVELNNEGKDTVYSTVSYSVATRLVEIVTLTGSTSIDVIGNSLANTLTGNSGNNRLDGGAGDDTMAGGAGNDIYIVDRQSDVVVELAGQGVDKVMTSVSYTLPDAVEALTMTGAGNVAAAGNGLDNILTGNSGNNRFTGNGGADRFVFKLNSGADRILDFSAAQGDVIDINAYSHGVTGGGGITLSNSGADTLIDLGGGNTIVVVGIHDNDAGLLSHIVW